MTQQELLDKMASWPTEKAKEMMRRGIRVHPPAWWLYPPLEWLLLYPYYKDWKLVKTWAWKKSVLGKMQPVRKYVFVKR